jgi:hypothetical protein
MEPRNCESIALRRWPPWGGDWCEGCCVVLPPSMRAIQWAWSPENPVLWSEKFGNELVDKQLTRNNCCCCCVQTFRATDRQHLVPLLQLQPQLQLQNRQWRLQLSTVACPLGLEPLANRVLRGLVRHLVAAASRRP